VAVKLYVRFLTFFTFFFKIQKTWLFTFFELLHTFSRTLVSTCSFDLCCQCGAAFNGGRDDNLDPSC